MDAGLTLNAIQSFEIITVVCDAGCVGTLPDGKPRRDSLQPRSDRTDKQEEENAKASVLERLVSRGEAGDEWEDEEGGGGGGEEFSKSLLSYDPTIGVVLHNLIRKKSTSIEQLLLENEQRTMRYEGSYSPSQPLRKFKEKKSLHRDHLEYQMYSHPDVPRTSSELAAQKSLNSFMKLASVRRILPTDVGTAFDKTLSGSGEMDPTRMNALNECLAFNRFTFAFGGSMDPSQSLNAGLQLRPNFNVAGGRGVLSCEDDVLAPLKSVPPDPLPIRKSSLQRLNGSQSYETAHTPLVATAEEKETMKMSSCFWFKSQIRRFFSLFRYKPSSNGPVPGQPLRTFFPELATSRPSTCSETSNASVRSKKTVRFEPRSMPDNMRFADTFEPAFLSAPFGAVKDRKTAVLTSQFGQIQYNPSTSSSLDPGNRRSSAGSSKSHHAVGGNSDPESLSTLRNARAGNDSTADLHSFPSFAEARTGIYQRLKTIKKRGKDNRIESGTKPRYQLDASTSSTTSAGGGGVRQNTVKFETKTAEDVFFAENKPFLADPHTTARGSGRLRYMNVDDI